MRHGSSTVHESDGVRVDPPCKSLARATLCLAAAGHQLWSTPGECAPDVFPLLLLQSCRAHAGLASVVAALAATDLDPARRAALAQVATLIGQAQSGLEELCRPAA